MDVITYPVLSTNVAIVIGIAIFMVTVIIIISIISTSAFIIIVVLLDMSYSKQTYTNW